MIVVIVQASRSQAWKGHAALADALATLRNVPGWTWWLAGGAQRPSESAFLEALRARVASGGVADRVRWLGERSDVPALLGAADVDRQANLALSRSASRWSRR